MWLCLLGFDPSYLCDLCCLSVSIVGHSIFNGLPLWLCLLPMPIFYKSFKSMLLAVTELSVPLNNDGLIEGCHVDFLNEWVNVIKVVILPLLSGLTVVNWLWQLFLPLFVWRALKLTGTSPPAPRYHHSAVMLDGSMFIFGRHRFFSYVIMWTYIISLMLHTHVQIWMTCDIRMHNFIPSSLIKYSSTVFSILIAYLANFYVSTFLQLSKLLLLWL